MDKYTQDYSIPYYMIDSKSQLRPSSFLDIAQELAALGAEPLGFADHHLEKYGIVWILARMQVKFTAFPRRLDTVKLETWHRGVDGLFFVRDYRLLDKDGNPLIAATSSWILMDVASRRALRTDRLGDIIPFEPQCTERVFEELAPKVAVAKDAPFKPIGSHKVVYSDLDANGHTNNVKYTVWAMDALPYDLVRDNDVKEIAINFNHEARMGDTVDLYLLEEDGAFIVEGRTGGQQVFIEKLVF